MSTLNKKTSLARLVLEHTEATAVIKDLQMGLNVIEHDIKRELLNQGMVDFLSINWTMVRRLARGIQ